MTAVNALGDFDIAADRLAIIDGESNRSFHFLSIHSLLTVLCSCVVDPWRPDTPHSDDARPRPDTTLRPFKLIPGMFLFWPECFPP